VERIQFVFHRATSGAGERFELRSEKIKWRRGSDSNRRVMVLQTIPLGHLGTAPYSLCPKSMPNAPYSCLVTPLSASLTH
jgi:hypothetical protein